MTTPATIKVGPWEIDPGLDFATFEELWPLVEQLDTGKGISGNGNIMAAFVLAAVKRLDPGVELAEVKRRCKLGELQAGFNAILEASGFRRADAERQPAPAAGAPTGEAASP